MSVAFDAVGPSSAGTASTSSTTLTWTHTAGSLTNGIVFVACALGIGSDAGAGLSATYGGTTMTSVGLVHADATTVGYVQMWYLLGPAAGGSTVTITDNGVGGTPVSLVGGSVSLSGVDQTTPIGTPVTASGSGSSGSVAVTGTTSGNMVIDAACAGSALSTSGQTLRWENNNNGSTGAGNAAASTASAGGTVTMSYSLGADFWGIIAVEVLAAGGGGPAGPYAVQAAQPFACF